VLIAPNRPGREQLIGENLNFQVSALVLVTLAVFFWRGGGRFSMDRLTTGAEPEPEAASQT